MTKAQIQQEKNAIYNKVDQIERSGRVRAIGGDEQAKRVRRRIEGGGPVELELDEANSILQCLGNTGQYYLTGDDKIELNKQKPLEPQDSILFHVREVTYEDEAPWKEALENVLSATRIPNVNFIYLLLGDRSGVKFYYGLSRDNAAEPTEGGLTINELGENVLQASISGNFRGSDVTKVEACEKNAIFKKIDPKHMRFAARIEGVPGSVKDDERFQSVDRLVDVMQGEPFALLVLARALTQEQTDCVERDIYKAYTELSPALKLSGQEGYSAGSSQSDSATSGISKGRSNSVSSSTTTSTESTPSSKSSTGTTNGGAEETNSGWNSSTSQQEGFNEGKSWTVSKERIQCSVQEWLKYCDDVVLPRLDYGRGKGLFAAALYVMAEKEDVLTRLVNTTQSLYSGKQGNRVPLRQFRLRDERELDAIRNLQFPAGRFQTGEAKKESELLARAFLSQLVRKSAPFALGNWITTNELAMIAGLPRKEVPGMCLREEVEFGLNCTVPERVEDRIALGRLIQNGNETDMPVYLDRKALDKHMFVAGVTGSGKTTTCQNILLHSELPFLVIEPAKSEYRILKKTIPDLIVFTLGDDKVAPFRMNPFEFMPEEGISSHVDMIKASIEAAFDMEAAIPQIIESALYSCYEDYGWDISTGENKLFQNPFDSEVCAFPRLSDLMKKIPAIVEQQGFDTRLKNDYIGSIRARLQSLTLGTKGCMLDTKRSIDWFSLLDKQVIFELEGIKSGSEKSLIMGFILTSFSEAVRERYLREKNRRPSGARHILLVEEAHRLLSKYMPGDSQNKKHGVEMFSDMLAEVRKYGECLIIADQIPNKLAEDVLKNTNTKIVHRIFAQDDKDAIGNTMALSEEQKQFLSSLGTGRAILFSDGAGQAMQVKINHETDTSSATLSNDELRRRVFRYYWNKEESVRPVFLQPRKELFGMDDLKTREDLLHFIQTDAPYRILNGMFETGCKKEYAALLQKALEAGIFDLEQLARWGMEQIPKLAAKLDTPGGVEALDLVCRYLERYAQKAEIKIGDFGTLRKYIKSK